jgi:hypothetical protein
MSGVDIISQEVITTSNSDVTVVVGLLLIVVTIFVVIYLLLTGKYDHMTYFLGGVLLIGVPIFLISVLLSSTIFRIDTGVHRYHAYIDKEVSMVEFYEKYDNVTFDGSVWTFTDKEPPNTK